MKQVIQRFEKKYLLDADQCRSFVMRLQPYITEDIYPVSTIYNLYLDTEQFDLIHRSIEKPPFKEKLRIRSYTPVSYTHLHKACVTRKSNDLFL